MGSSYSVETVVTNINNEIRTEVINNAGASAGADCAIKIGTVNIGDVRNCNITFSNLCSAQAEASVESTIDAVMSVVNDLDVNQQAAAAKYFTMSVGIQTNVTNISNSIRTYLENNCKAEGYINNQIFMDAFNVGKCYADTPIDITVTNVGQASANCVIQQVLNVAMEATNDVTEGQATGNNWSDILWIVVAGFAVCCAAFIVYLVFKNVLIKPGEKEDIELAKQGAWSAKIKSLTRNKTYD